MCRPNQFALFCQTIEELDGPRQGTKNGDRSSALGHFQGFTGIHTAQINTEILPQLSDADSLRFWHVA